MKRVLAVVLIAALTTLMVGIDRTTWAGQVADQKKSDQQRAAVVKALRGMDRGTTATVERKNGEKFDVVIEEITVDTITVLRQDRTQVSSETIAISEIAKIKKTSVKKMGTASKILIGTAIGLGILVAVAVGTCSATPVASDSAASEASPRM
jgi:ribosomal protein L24